MKESNVTGVCIPKLHYMVDTSNKLEQILKLVEKGKYFTIHRPRQYGKTTTLNQLTEKLNHSEEYFALKLSFEGVSTESYATEYQFLHPLQLGNLNVCFPYSPYPVFSDSFSKLDQEFPFSLSTKNRKKCK